MAVIWQLSIKHHKNGSTIRGVILSDSPGIYRVKRNGLANMLRVIRSYFVKPLAKKEVTLKLASETLSTETDARGHFKIDLSYKVSSVDEILIDDTELTMAFDYPVLFPETNGKYEVISDIDDTIMISYTASTLKRVTTLLFTAPFKRKRIDFTHGLAEHLVNFETKVNYVSKSESNLYGLITTFVKNNSFPKGDIYLTPYLGFREMLSGNKPPNFKEETISSIINNSDKKFILVGDDTQRDMDVYAQIVEKYSDRIFRVYIRQTKSSMKSKAREFLARLKKTGVEVVIFMNDDIFTSAHEIT